MTPLPTEGDADLWAPVRDESYVCHACNLMESCLNNEGSRYATFRARWNDVIKPSSNEEHQAQIDVWNREDEQAARTWTWPEESEHGIRDRAWRAARLADETRERTYTHTTIVGGELAFERVHQIPVNTLLFAQILAVPDDAAARVAYAKWLRMQPHSMADESACFIEAQLQLAQSFKRDPKVDIKDHLPQAAFGRRTVEKTDLPDQEWWRFPQDADVMGAMCDFTKVLREVGLTDDERHYRGFVEHVAIKASRFLEIADELYSLAPIRQLTITYCKGIDHSDTGLLKALLDSPHLDRIHALKLPVRKFGWDKGDATTLNALTDTDIEMLATSEHLRGLTYLDLEDQKRLTIRAFDALAASSNLRSLSAVRHDINRYAYPGTFSFGTVGKQTRALADRPLASYAKELESRHGRIPWLHIAENYGTETPDVEAVVEHPIAARSQT